MTARTTLSPTSPPTLVGRATDALGKAPTWAIAAALVVGAALADIDVALDLEPGAAEPAQWIGRISIKLYWILLPWAMLALWARRRQGLGRVGRVAAGLIVPQIVASPILVVATIIWGLLLGRGDVDGLFVVLFESIPTTLFYLGVVVLSVAHLRDSDGPRTVGALLLLGLVLSFGPPGLLTLVFSVLAVLLLRTGSQGRPGEGY